MQPTILPQNERENDGLHVQGKLFSVSDPGQGAGFQNAESPFKTRATYFQNLIDQNFGLQFRIARQERVKQLDGMFDVVGTAGLPNRVHAELRIAKIQRANTHLCGQHGTDSTTARAVVPHDK